MPKQSITKKSSLRSPTKKKIITKKKPVNRKRAQSKKVFTISKEPVFNPFTRTGLTIIIALLTAVYLLVPGYGTSNVDASITWVQSAKANHCPIDKVFGIPPTISEKVNTHPRCTRMMKRILLNYAPTRITKYFKGADGKFPPGLTTSVILIKQDFHDANVYGQYDGIVDARMWQIIRFIHDYGYRPDLDTAPTGPSWAPAVWPFPTKSKSQFDRVDQGWDLASGVPGEFILAIAPGKIGKSTPDSGGFGNDYPYEILDTPLIGKSVTDTVYYGHVHVIPGVVGKHVHTGQIIATANVHDGDNGSAAAPGYLEIGFSNHGTGSPPIKSIKNNPYGQTMHDILINAPRY